MMFSFFVLGAIPVPQDRGQPCISEEGGIIGANYMRITGTGLADGFDASKL